jgi:arylsulfatase A-like enzyme
VIEGPSSDTETAEREILGAGFLLMLALWFGLLTGLVEVAYLLRRVLNGVFVWRGQQALWMIPVAEGVLFVIAALLILVLRRASKRLRTLAMTVALLAFLSAFSLLLLYGRLHLVSNFLLAAGLGALIARLVGLRPHLFRRVVRWTCAPLVALVVALAVGLNLWLGARERQLLASLPPAADDAPNILLIVLDTVRAPSLSLYSYPRSTTPNLERLARLGVRFDRAIAPSSWTLPTHATMFTGREPHEHRTNWGVPLDDTYPTLAEYLGRHGYRTGAFVANVTYTSWQTGLTRGFSHYEDYGFSFGEWVRCSSIARVVAGNERVRRILGFDDVLGRQGAPHISHLFLEWVQEPSSRPFFAFLNYYDAHFPYLPPQPFGRRFGLEDPARAIRPLRIDTWIDTRVPTAQQSRNARDAYEGAIAYLDSELGKLFAELERRDLLDQTIFILTSDHGEAFAEHRVLEHGNSLYLPTLHVPLVIIHSRSLPGGVVETPVGLRDLPATIVDMLDLESEAPFPGRSLVRSLDRETTQTEPILSEIWHLSGFPDWVPASRGDMYSLVLDSLHYILNGDGREEIYNIDKDPSERQNLAPTLPPGLPVIDELRSALDRMVPVDQRRPPRSTS